MYPGHLLLVLACALLLVVPRRWAITVFMAACIFIPKGVSVTVGPLNFYPVRILVVIGFLRIFSRGERPRDFGLKADVWVIIFAIIFTLASFGHEAGAFTGDVALVLDTLGLYFLMRAWVRDWEDFGWFLKTMVVFMIPLSIAMGIEYKTHTNPFSYIGGIPAESAMRDDLVRARGPFRHSIFAGVFGAVTFPIILAMRREKHWYVRVALVCSLLIVFFSTSGGPLMTFCEVLFGLMMWRWRSKLKLVIRAGILALIFLQLVMKAPVWFLISKIDIGGDGYSRAKIIDSAVHHFGDWWLCGTDYTRDWMSTGIAWSENHTDITNQYINYGVVGGVGLMVAFIGILTCCFKTISRALHSPAARERNAEFLVWCVGCAMYGHAVNMISVSYYDQSIALLYPLIGATVSACHSLARESGNVHSGIDRDPQPTPVFAETVPNS